MAKCTICSSRKGKRFCKRSDTFICSLCCGETREAAVCSGCEFYREPDREKKYSDFPMIPLPRMEADFDLQDYANAIEGTLCAFDQSEGRGLRDKTALRILELLLDKYHFEESDLIIEDSLVEKGFILVVDTIESDLADVSEDLITKIIGSIYFVAKRRSQGNREYLDFIDIYVGVRLEKGIRRMKRWPSGAENLLF